MSSMDLRLELLPVPVAEDFSDPDGNTWVLQVANRPVRMRMEANEQEMRWLP